MLYLEIFKTNMNVFFRPPEFDDAESNIAARLNFYLALGFILFSVIFLIVVHFVAPELTRRSSIMAGVIVPFSLFVMILVHRKKLLIAGGAFVSMLWLIITTTVISAGGVSAPIFIGYLVLIVVSGLIFKQKGIIASGIISIFTGIILAILQSQGLLPAPIDYSPIARISVYTFFLVTTALLQVVNARNTQELLSQSKKSEEQYRSLLENIPSTTYINSTDASAQTEYISPQVEQLLGYPRNAFTDDPLLWTKILHPDDMQRVQDESVRTSETGEPFKMEYRLITRENKVIWVKDEANLVHDSEGKPLYWLGIWSDITSKKEVEAEQTDMVGMMTKRTVQLQTASEVARAATSILDINELLPTVVELIRNHFEYYYVGIFLVDEIKEWASLSAATGIMGQQMLDINHRLKVEDSSMIGWSITHKEARIALDVGEDAVRFANPYLPLTRSEIALPLITHAEVIGAMTIQSEKPAAFSKVDITALQIMADQVANAIENARLFTERLRLNNELEAQNEELERFTYTVSHDLRSPLVTIRGFLGYLRQDAEAGDLTRFDKDMNRIANAVDKMQALLNELLELSRVGRIANPPEDVPFGEIVQETIDLLEGPLEAGNIRLDIAKEFPVVHVDRLRISEVMQNLLSNAIKFMGDQSRPTIEIGTNGTDTDGNPIIFVRDNGIGIDPKYHERVFGLFNRLDPSIDGTGIGLTLVKRIVDIHGGRIWIESQPGSGATFLFTLPTANRVLQL